MSSTAGLQAKKKVTISKSFLNNTNPEIFITKPRAGGYVTLQEPKKKCEDEDEDSQPDEANADKKSEKKMSVQEVQEQISREFRIHKSLYDSTWTLSTLDESGSSIEVPTPVEDSIDMLTTALSTVMLMAAEVASIPPLSLDWTKNYFECIKDDYGHIPPNIQGILNHMAYLKAAGEGGDGGGTGSRRGSKTVRTTTTVRRKSSAASETKPPEEAAPPPAAEEAADIPEAPEEENPPEEEP